MIPPEVTRVPLVKFGKLGRLDRFHALQSLEIALERMTGDVEAERRLFSS